MEILDAFRAEFRRWTIAGPLILPASMDPWLPTELDGATAVPVACSMNGQAVPIRRVEIPGEDLDLRAHLPAAPGLPQAVVFCEVTAPRDVTLTLSYDADWCAVWWLDGREIFDTRRGNAGAVGEVRHRFLAPLARGRHVFAVRLVSGWRGWRLIVRVEGVENGIADLLRTDRDAAWRDYTRAAVRIEDRPLPNGRNGEVSMEVFESMMMNSGVDARWLGVVRGNDGPLFRNQTFPPVAGVDPGFHEEHLQRWVKTIHGHRTSVLTWYSMMFCHSAWEAHQDWRQQFLKPPAPGSAHADPLCFNSPYGEALIAFVIETVKKFELDGFWFDGSSLTPVWDASPPVSCICPHCAMKFREATGLALPTALDWAQPSFRPWVHWRYESFRAFWLRLVREVKAAVPQAAIAFNNYHREGNGWITGIPWRRFDAPFVAGTEADGEPMRGLYYGRLMRGFNAAQTEVWMSFTGSGASVGPRGPTYHPRRIMDFAVAAATGGSHCSVGGVRAHINSVFLRDFADELRMRAPYLDLPAVPQIGLHLSMQTETYVFGRDPEYPRMGWPDEYGSSVAGWHHALAWSGLTCDVLFDDALDRRALGRYPVVVAPLAVALSPRQCRTLLAYVRAGGTLVTGPWFGRRNEWGEGGPVLAPADAALFPFGQAAPDLAALNARAALRCRGAAGIDFEGRPLYDASAVHGGLSVRWSARHPLVRKSALGKGRIVQLAFDPGGLFRATRERAVCRFVGDLLRSCFTPLVEAQTEGDVVLGLYRRGPRETIVHLQQLNGPWAGAAATAPRPAALWNVALRWHGGKPRTVRCLLPETGPALPCRRAAGEWHVPLPPFTWGHVVAVEEG